jgi:integrase
VGTKQAVIAPLLHGAGGDTEPKGDFLERQQARRDVIHVRQAKGKKDRFVMLSPRLLAILRAYWSLERPPAPWLFESSTGRHLNPDTAREAIKLAAAKVGLQKRVTPHGWSRQ